MSLTYAALVTPPIPITAVNPALIVTVDVAVKEALQLVVLFNTFTKVNIWLAEAFVTVIVAEPLPFKVTVVFVPELIL